MFFFVFINFLQITSDVHKLMEKFILISKNLPQLFPSGSQGKAKKIIKLFMQKLTGKVTNG